MTEDEKTKLAELLLSKGFTKGDVREVLGSRVNIERHKYRKTDVTTNGKTCKTCGVFKPLTSYHKCGNSPLNVRPACIECFNAERARLRQQTFEEALKFYSNGTCVCFCCGEHRKEFLTFDHINGRSDDEKLLSNGKRQSVTSILHDTPRSKWPTDLRVACYNCNLARGRCGYCPHESERAANSETTNVVVMRKEG